jgi:hypothetical protein
MTDETWLNGVMIAALVGLMIQTGFIFVYSHMFHMYTKGTAALLTKLLRNE